MTGRPRLEFLWLLTVPILASSCGSGALAQVEPPDGIGTTFSPSWSPDGSAIAAIGCGDAPRQDVFVYSLSSRTATVLRGLEDDFLGNGVAWSPDGANFAVQGGPADGPYGIWLLRHAETNDRFLAPGDDASWSPDGTRLAVISSAGDTPMVQIIEVDSGTVVASFGFERVAAGPTLIAVKWSHGGERVAVVSSNMPTRGYPTLGVYLIDLGTRAVTPVFVDSHVSAQRGLAWSTDDSWLLFTVNTGGGAIAAAPLDATCGFQLLTSLAGVWGLDLSPDGMMVALTQNGRLLVGDTTRLLGRPLEEAMLCPPA